MTKTNNIAVSVIMINHNSIQCTVDCIESLKESNYTDFEVVVVDNGSEINYEQKIRSIETSFQVKWIRSDQNLGFSGGNNLGIDHAVGHYLFFINNDTEITSDLISKLIETLDNNPQAGIVNSKNFFYRTDNVQ